MAVVVDDCTMVELAIRCHPCVPVALDEFEHWLERQLSELRAAVPGGTIRMSRLTQGLPDSDIDIGWLIELELDDGQAPLADERLGEIVRDMRMLGLQPKLLAPLGHSELALGR